MPPSRIAPIHPISLHGGIDGPDCGVCFRRDALTLQKFTHADYSALSNPRSEASSNATRLETSIGDASGHRRRVAQRAMDLDEVVREIAERQDCGMILKLFVEGICEPRVSPIRHADQKVVTLHEAGRETCAGSGSPIHRGSLLVYHSIALFLSRSG